MDDETCFVYPEDEEAKDSPAQLKDLEVGEFFYFRGKKFVKMSEVGWVYAFYNVAIVENGNGAHLHPTTQVNRIN